VRLARRGEIWFVYTPGQPGDPRQPRPALVISEDVRNRLSDDLVVVPIFSTGRPGPVHVMLQAPMGGIPHDSVLFCEEFTAIAEGFLADGPLGASVPEVLLRHVVRAIRRAIGEVIPEP